MAAAWLHIPLQLYYFNQLDLGYDLGLVGVLALVGLGLLLFSWLALGLLAWLAPRKANALATGFLLLGLGVVLTDLFAPLSLHALDGTELKSDEPLLLTLVELAIWLGLLGLGWRLRAERLLPQAGLILGILLLVDLGFGGLAWVQVPAAKPPAPARSAAATPSAIGSGPNVYHIVLDALQTDFLLDHLTRHHLEAEFTGFTLFRQSHSHYPYTLFSMTSIMTSSLYQQGSSVAWVEARYEGLPKEAKANGYRWTSMAKNRFFTPYDDVSVDAESLFLTKSYLQHPQIVDFARLSLARSLPNPLTNEALAAGKTLGLALGDQLNQGPQEKQIPRTVNDGMEPYAGAILLRHALETESQRQLRGEYLFLHPIIPHGPYVMDQHCTYHPPAQGDQEPTLEEKRQGYQGQVACAVSLVQDFLQELRRLGRYETSLIVIHGDHGEGYTGVLNLDPVWANDAEAKRVFRPGMMNWKKYQVEARSQAALLVKPPGAGGALQVSLQDAQLRDIYPTIRHVLAWSGNRVLSGRSLYAWDLSPRQRPFFFFKSTQGRFQLSDVEQFEVPLQHNFADLELIPQGKLSLVKQRPLQAVEEVDLATLGLSLEGFSGIDQKDGVTFVASEGKEMAIGLPFLQVAQPQKVKLELQLEVEQPTQIQASLQGQKQTFALKPGWQSVIWEVHVLPEQAVKVHLAQVDPSNPRLRFSRLRIAVLP